MKESTSIKGTLIGVGNVGAKYDLSETDLVGSRTHLKALQRNDKIDQIHIVDPDVANLKNLANAPKVCGLSSQLSEVNLSSTESIVTIAAPSSSHTKLLVELNGQDFPCRNIICEKPLAYSLADIRELQKLPGSFTKKIIVNYSRTWSNDHQQVLQIAKENDLGKLLYISGVYDKGMVNNGVHLIDYLWGILDGKPEVLWCGNPIFDSDSSPTVSLNARIKDVPIYIVGNDARNYSRFEIHLFFKEGSISLTDSGRKISILKPQTHPEYQGYQILNPSSERETDLNCSLDKLLQEITEDQAVSNFKRSLEVEEFCLEIASKNYHGEG